MSIAEKSIAAQGDTRKDYISTARYNPMSQSVLTLKLSLIATSRFVRALTVSTAILLAVQPLLVSLAQAQVISDPTAPIQFRPGIGMSPGGAPVVDITAPSFGGLSHNKFESFNVDQNGLILNNSGLGGNSIIGGAIPANPNLVGRQPARTILNEVTGSGSSHLGGTTEVFGGRADVIVANPNGVGCFGCSFINAGRITLSSGTPLPDYASGTVGFDVRGGAVVVSGSGLSGVAGFAPLGDIDLIGRQIAIDAPIVAQDRVRLRSGAMTYQPSGDLVTPIAGAAALTGASIVSSAAGTISAGSISLLSRDLDLGVVLGGNLETSSGSIVISSLGDAILAGTKSAADLRIDAAGNVELLGRHEADGYLAASGDTIIVELADISFADGVVLEALGDLFASGDIVSGTDISLVAHGQVVATGRILAGGRVALEGREIIGFDLDVGGTHISVAATEDVAIEDTALAAAADVSVSGRDVTLGYGTVFGAPGRLFVGARRDFTNATVLDYANLSLSIGNSFTNTQTGAYIRDELAINIPGSVVNAGLLQGRILASIAARSLENTATGLIDAPDLLIAIDEDVLNAGLVLGREQLAIAARSLSIAQTGVVDADAVAMVTDGAVVNAGALRGRDGLEILASDLTNLASGLIIGETVGIAVIGGLANLGEILSPESLAILAGGDIANDGVIATGGELTLTAASYVAGSEAARLAGANIELLLAGQFDNAGSVVAQEGLGLTAGAFANRDTANIFAQAAIDLALSGDFDNSGLILSEHSVAITAQALANQAGGVVFGPELTIMLGGGGMNSGKLLAADSLSLEAGGGIVNDSEIRSLQSLTLRSASYVAGSPAAQLAGIVADLFVTGAFDNAGLVLGAQSLALTASSLTNRAGAEIAASVADLVVTGNANNHGLIEAGLILAEIGGAFTNSGSLLANAPGGGDIALVVGAHLLNQGDIRAGGDILASAGSMTSGSGSHLEGESVALVLAGMLHNAGVIRARGDLAASASRVVNAGQAGAQAWISGATLDITAGADVTIGAHSVLEGRAATRLVAQTSNVDLYNAASIAAGRFNFGQNLALSLSGQSLYVAPGQQIMAAGDLSLMFGGDVIVLGTIASGAGLTVASSGGSLLVGTTGSAHHGGALLFTLGDAHFAAAGNLRLVSSAIEVLGSASVNVGGALMLERSGGTYMAFSHSVYVQGSQLWREDHFYEYESATQSVLNVAGNLLISAGHVHNHISTISAGGNLIINAAVVENLSRQLQRYQHHYKLTGDNTGFRGVYGQGIYAATPAVMYAGGTLAINASQSSVNTGTQIGNQVSLIAPSITVGITDRNVFTAPPSLPDPVIDLSRHLVALPGFAAQPTPVAITADGPRYLYTAPFANQPRYDPQGLPISEREPSWIMRQVGDNRGDLVFLADPITERMLIQRALVEQTGRTMLDPRFGNPAAQQEALYEGTVSFLLDNPEIRLGDALTAAQRASVTAPMLWYVARDIDGVRVLSPELILPEAQLAAYAYRPGGSVQAVEDLFIQGDRVTNTGALMAGGSLVIHAGEFLNERRVASMFIGHQVENRAQAGGVVSAASLMIQTDRDLINRGGTLMGETGVTLLAGGDIRFEAQRVANDLTFGRGNRTTEHIRSVDHYAASAGTSGDLIIAAGGAFTLIGSSLLADGDVSVTARDGMTIASVVDQYDSVSTRRTRGFLSSSSTSWGSTAYTNIASVIGAGGDIDLRTGGDISVLASTFAAGGDMLLAAGVGEGARADASVSILAGTDYSSSFFQQKKSGFGLFFGGGRLDFYRASNVRDDAMDAVNAPSSLIAGGDVTILAPGDLTLQGSVVGAGGYATLAAGRDLAVTPGSEADARSHFAQRSSFGFGVSSGGGSASLSLGLARSSLLQAGDRASAVGSLIGGGEGVLLQAGRDLTIAAARITSPGDIDLLAGRDLAVLPGASAQSRTEITRQSFAGVTASVSTNVVGAAQQLRAAVDTFDSGYGNATYRAIGMASGVMQATDAVRSLSNPSVSASLSLGFSQSSVAQYERATGIVPAELDAGRDLTLSAGRDLALVAVQARAERDLALFAGRNLVIESAQATYDTATRSSSSAASIGLGASFSAQGGPSVGMTVSGEMARGRSDAEGVAQVNAQLRAGERLLVSTGADALVAGAVLRAREVDLLVGGDLTIASRQDTGRIRGSSANIGGSLTIGLVGPSSASLNVGGGYERGDRTMVAEQTAIIADERLDAYVGNHTQIDGAILASLNGDLLLDTNTLSFTDIEDQARYNAASAQLGVTLGGSLPGVSLSGEIAEAETDAITRATVGECTRPVSAAA